MSEHYNIVLAEDNEADFFLLKEALTFVNMNVSLQRACDGEAALDALREMERLQSPVDLILLDLNLPKVSGHELLAHVRRSDQLRSTPVMVLTSSDAPEDRARTSALRVSHYFQKPSNFEEFLLLGNTIRRICRGELARAAGQAA